MEHYYSLEKYAGPASRHQCPACGRSHCFAYYVDESGDILDESVGRCDHESSCGYHHTPKAFFRDNPDALDSLKRQDWRLASPELIKRLKEPKKPLCDIPFDFVRRSVRTDILSDFVMFLLKLFDVEVVKNLIVEYCLGVTKQRQVIFFQIDTKGRVRTGKIMKYDRETGHRIKDEAIAGRIAWAHNILMKQGHLPQDWTLSQCLFGEHLLRKYPDKPVSVVESEKTAVICAAVMPQNVWLATGGKSQLNERLEVLKGRQVTLWPDIDGVDEWKRKVATMGHLDIKVADIYQYASEEDHQNHIDIADILIESILSNKDLEPLREVPQRHTPPKEENTTTRAIKKSVAAMAVDEALELAKDLDLHITSVRTLAN